MVSDEVIRLVDNDSLVEIDLMGARINRLVLDGKTVLSSFRRIDGKMGSTHPCTPNFDKDKRKAKVQLPQHGPARNEVWRKIEASEKMLKLGYKMDGEKFPGLKGLSVEQTFKLTSGELTIETTHANDGSEAMPVNFGEHFYFDTTGAGWGEVTINGEKIASEVKITGRIKLNQANKIRGLAAGDLVLFQEGLPMVTTWSGRNEDETKFDNDYVCIEPVEGRRAEGDDPGFFGTKESMIEPNQSRKTVIKLSLKD